MESLDWSLWIPWNFQIIGIVKNIVNGKNQTLISVNEQAI